ncbi:MAG: 30S ribosomal protein S24e [Candidatus Bathyarchaeota archaeon]|nr:30S ribosomal protein S24e [Candidatus Bathyarchaeota archaeon]
MFNRKEVEFKVEEKSTPTRSKIRVELAVAFRVDLDQVYVREIETLSGSRVTVGEAHIYDDPELALKVEPKHIVERNQKAAPEPEPEPKPEPEPEPETPAEPEPEPEPEPETPAEPEPEASTEEEPKEE